jgi:hypothetical protein
LSRAWNIARLLSSRIWRKQLAWIIVFFLNYGVVLTPQASAAEATPTDGHFSLPMELEFDSGADNGDAAFLKLAPLYKSPLSENWSMINIDLLALIDSPGGVPGSPGNPSPSPGDRTFGLGDLTHLTVCSRESDSSFLYGMGFMLTLPTASDSTLGSEKWSAGPAFRVTYREGAWNVGVFGGNQWSYDGSSDRGDVNQLILRGSVRRNLDNDWYLVSAPLITANWKAKKSSDTWMLPLGGGIGKVLNVRSMPWAISLQAYANVVKPDGAPDWVLRFALIAPLPRAAFGL